MAKKDRLKEMLERFPKEKLEGDIQKAANIAKVNYATVYRMLNTDKKSYNELTHDSQRRVVYALLKVLNDRKKEEQKLEELIKM